MTDEAKETISARIRKLMRHADSARSLGSLAEAQAFAGKANELLLAHKLEMRDVDLSEGSDAAKADPMKREMLGGSKRKRSAWRERLAGIVARAHFCRIAVSTGSDRLYFYGRASDLELTLTMFRSLALTAEIESKKAERRDRKRARMEGYSKGEPGYRRAWLTGFVAGIRDQYDRERAAFKQRAGEQASTALIVLNDKAVEEYFRKCVRGWRNAAGIGGGVSRNSNGYQHGHAFGSSVNARGRQQLS